MVTMTEDKHKEIRQIIESSLVLVHHIKLLKLESVLDKVIQNDVKELNKYLAKYYKIPITDLTI